MKLPSILVLTVALVALSLPVQAGAGKGDPNKKAAKKAAKAALAQYDTNSNGSIDGDEVAAIQKAYEDKKDTSLKTFDTNNDGKLDASEISAIHAGKKGSKGAKKKKAA